VELPAEREREDVSYAGGAEHLLHLAAQSVAYRRLTDKLSAQHALASVREAGFPVLVEVSGFDSFRTVIPKRLTPPIVGSGDPLLALRYE